MMAVTDAMSRIATKTRQAQERSTVSLEGQECKAVGKPWADEVIGMRRRMSAFDPNRTLARCQVTPAPRLI